MFSGQQGRAITASGATFVVILAIALIHIVLPFRFPVPWPDETSFIAPSFELARHGTLFVWAMNPDRPVMWMPPGYFFFLAGLFKLFGYGFALARWASAACIVGAAIIVTRLVRVFTAGRVSPLLYVLTVPAFLSPYVLISANMARMEALFALVQLASLLACLRGRPVLGLAIVALSGTIHFNAVYFLLPFGVWLAEVLARRQRLVVQPVELYTAVVVGAIVAAYGFYVAHNAAGFIEDIDFQLRLKRFFGHDDPYHPLWPLLAACLFSLVVFARQRTVDAPMFLALFGTSFVLMATEGREIWYDMAPPLGFLLIAIGLAATDGTGATLRTLSFACLLPCAACLAATGYRPTPFLSPLLPSPAMLSHALVPRGEIKRMRRAIAGLPAGGTVEFAWGGIQPFFFDTLDRAGLRWGVPQHSVTDPTLTRRPDWMVRCDSPDAPPSVFLYLPPRPHPEQPAGCSLFRP